MAARPADEAEASEAYSLGRIEMVSNDEDLYLILGVERTASMEELRKAYRKTALKTHPDKNRGKPEDVISELCLRYDRASVAFQILRDPERREAWDHGFYGRARGWDSFRFI